MEGETTETVPNEEIVVKSKKTMGLDKPGMSDEEKVRRMEDAAKRLETANKKFEDYKVLMEEAKVNGLLGGVAEVGVQKKEESPQQYANRIMKGDYDE